jgi:hypothetical protein
MHLAYVKKVILVAGLVVMAASMLAAAAGPSGTASKLTASVSVDRANKGDRLPPRSKTHVNSSLTTTPQVRPQRPPLGCDPAISSLTDPPRANIYKRCTA